MASPTRLRIRRLLAERGPLVVLVLALVGATALGGGYYLYTTPPTTEVTDATDQQTIRTELRTGGETSGETELFGAGQQLENEPVYLDASVEQLRLRLQTTTPEGTTAQVDQRVVLELRATTAEQTFWSEDRQLTRETTETDRAVVTRTTLDVAALRERLAAVEGDLGAAGSIDARLRVDVSYDTGTYDGTITRRAPVELGDGFYTVETTSAEETRERAVTRTATVPRDRLSYLLPFGVGGASLITALWAASWWYRQAETVDVEQLTRRLQRARHAEWISTGAIEELDANQRVRIETLEGLVDVAIDSDRRVVHDRSKGIYAVRDGETVYYHGQPPMPTLTDGRERVDG
jgi:hypothetical protein